jgi:hypothetical protein
MPSAVVAVETERAEEMEALVHVADVALRTEDAILALSERRALLLLVASPLESCGPVMQRLGAGLTENGVAPQRLAWSARPADGIALPEGSAVPETAWKECFDALAPWPASSAG